MSDTLSCECGAHVPYAGRGIRAKRCPECRLVHDREMERRRYNPESRHEKHRCVQARDRGATVLRISEYKEQRAARGRDREATNRALIEVALAEGCLSCGELDPIVLEFDHVRGDKVRNVTEMMGTEALRAEIAKCDVRCANCHLRRHRTPQNLGLRRM